MTHLDLKKHYSHFLSHQGENLHFAAHSHHYWPDVSRDAHIEYWDDSSRLVDDKWNHIFSKIIPKSQEIIARLLNLKSPSQIAFAPNTHELVTRVLSHFLGRSSVSILTTSSEFHSFKRQLLRLKEFPQIKITTVSTENLLHQKNLFLDEIKFHLKSKPTIFYISQVFFDSGLALKNEDLISLVSAASDETTIIIDGYHGFAALPTDLSHLEGRIFYVSGGYKYAQAGEGAGFMVVPKGEWRPAHTGWFAEYADLTAPSSEHVGYSLDAMAFMGATQDPSGLYRFNKVWDHFQNLDLSIEKIHAHITSLQTLFIENLPSQFLLKFDLTPLFHKDLSWHGHFLTFKSQTEESAKSLEAKLRTHGIFIDRRGNRLRFGLGLYHCPNDVRELIRRIEEITK
jgi:selenocysteine lyase/cysteine desulfurase